MGRGIVLALVGCVGLGSVFAVGCGADATVGNGGSNESPPNGGPFVGEGASGGGSTGKNPDGTSFCSATGGIALPNAEQTCTADLAAKTFRFGLCSCSALALSGSVQTSSFDSKSGQSNLIGGSIGTNDAFGNAGSVTIGGTLWAQGKVTLEGASSVAGQLRAGGGIESTGATHVKGDLFSSTPPEGLIIVDGKSNVPASVSAPCDCSAPLPIASYIDAFEKNNDNAAEKIDPKSLVEFDSKDLTLNCGRYYFDAITGSSLHLHLKGRTAIFVRGDFDLKGSVTLRLEPGAELDLFVGDNFALSGSTVFGDTDAPARIRVYVAGKQVELAGATTLAGNLYAPHAKVGHEGSLTVRGSLFAESIEAEAALDLVYDEAVLKVQGCRKPDAGCATCNDCGGNACKGGKCGACTSDADCCAPLRCSGGECLPSVR